jgi:hypothetical protein
MASTTATSSLSMNRSTIADALFTIIRGRRQDVMECRTCGHERLCIQVSPPSLAMNVLFGEYNTFFFAGEGEKAYNDSRAIFNPNPYIFSVISPYAVWGVSNQT